MDTNLLRSWLGLAPGDWPPEDRVLLGLPSGPVDAADIERRALVLMGKLRVHQLVHPELVTEGMNRLAQAMLAVSTAAQSPVRFDDSPAAEVVLDLAPDTEAARFGEPQVATKKPVDKRTTQTEPTRPTPTPVPGSGVSTTQPKRRSVAIPIPALDQVPEFVISPTVEARRDAYRELAGLRGLMQAWLRLRVSIGTPDEMLPGAAEIFDYLTATQAIRQAMIHPGLRVSLVGELAPQLETLIRMPLSLGVVRSLTKTQRERLARDWSQAYAMMSAIAQRTREAVRAAKPARPVVTMNGIETIMTTHPEWVLIFAMVTVFIVAAVRITLR